MPGSMDWQLIMGVDAQMDLDPAGWIYIYTIWHLEWLLERHWKTLQPEQQNLVPHSQGEAICPTWDPFPCYETPSRNHGWFKDYPQMTTIQQGFRLSWMEWFHPRGVFQEREGSCRLWSLDPGLFGGPGGPFFCHRESAEFSHRPGHRRSLGAKCLEAEPIDERKRFNGWSITGC